MDDLQTRDSDSPGKAGVTGHSKEPAGDLQLLTESPYLGLGVGQLHREVLAALGAAHAGGAIG